MPRHVDISSPLFGERLKALRRKHGLSRRDVADALDVSTKAITNWENGHQEKALEHNILRLAQLLEVEFDYLVYGREPESTAAKPVAGPSPSPRRFAILLVVLAAVLVVGYGVLQRARARDVEVVVEGNRIVARDGILGWRMWSDQFDSNVFVTRMIGHGRGRMVTVGLSGTYPDTGRLMCRRARDGRILWEDRPDLAEAGRVFGPVGAETVGFGVRRMETADIDGDGVPEIAVQYGHNKWFPSYVRIYRIDGTVVGTYYNGGACYDLRASDIDHDGKDEILVAATNNGAAYEGASLILLDELHCNGASRDSLMMADCPLPDSSAVRVVFPQWDQRYMSDCGARPGSGRLQAERINTHFTPDGSARITIDVAVGTCILVVTLDGDLHPLHADLSDAFVGSMNSWPEADRRTFLVGLDSWLKSSYRYGAAADE